MKYTIYKYTGSPEKWDEFIDSSNNGTIFHKLSFLNYHGEKFQGNEHHLAICKGTSFYALLPMAFFVDDGRKVARSPYGGSYGGPVFLKPQSYSDSKEIINVILTYLKQQNINEIQFTFPLSICEDCYSETFRFVLLEQGFECVCRDISSVACLDKNNSISNMVTSRVRNMARKARKARKVGVEIVQQAPLEDFWQVLKATFTKHGVDPTHTEAELRWLHNRFPEQIYVDVAYFDKNPIAGIGYLVINKRVISSFYLCQDTQYQKMQALSLLIYNALDQGKHKGFHYFDFGTSSVNMLSRPNIFRFKEGFGAVGVFRETYLWKNK